MKKIAVLSLLIPLGALLAGCNQIEETAGEIASDAASQVAGAAAEEVQQQVCSLVSDGNVSAGDRELLGGLVDAAETAGVPAEITGPLRDIAAAGDQVPAESVEALNEACAPSS
ncbi:hypothetical protein P4U43_12980 [Arthrobacter sp. EH-1B-1]|uniref:Lipoprotein n=1 Tax=Arthrobacter vasquezii TaxID=2977629 RepID=A0ABT6CX94_9MICC|nr:MULTISPECIES: hypothetical protein [Arthrobacter]KRF03927.1 hypothetical protein ASH00_14770 [Arthrobacter sp. Soil782]MDF9278702.1 hypothetical protein [Arthrobacter vasquezii]